MRKGVSILALLVSTAALVVAVAAYLGQRSCVLCDDFDDDVFELYDDDDCDFCGDAPPKAAGPAKETAGTDDEAAE